MDSAEHTPRTRGRGSRGPGPKGPAAPLYKRLPHGPHQLEREQVRRHQRARIHGAMVEAVALGGYDATSVRQVIGLAGVSRRSFYEHFANKQECFLATFDLIVRRELARMRSACEMADGSLEDRLRAAFVRLSKTASEQSNAVLLVLVQAQTAGTAGTLRVRRAATACEQLLAGCFADSGEAGALPAPVLRAITGGLYGVISRTCSDSDADRRTDVGADMLRWTLLFKTATDARVQERMSAPLAERMRAISRAAARRRPAPRELEDEPRARLLQSALRLAGQHDFRDLTVSEVADAAEVSIEGFFELFGDLEVCYLAALEMLGAELIAITSTATASGGDWARGARDAVAGLMHRLTERPVYARTIGQGAFFAGPEAATRNLELSRAIATLLTRGAPSRPDCELVLDGIAGALWHTVRCQVAGGRIELLGALADPLSFVVLAPFIGAEAALEVVTEHPAR